MPDEPTAADEDMSTAAADFDEEGPESPDDIEDLDIEDLEDIDDSDDDVLDDDALDADNDDSVEAVLEVVPGVAEGSKTKVKAAAADPAAEAETDDDELLADEVEASLDVILAERLRGGESEADEEIEDDEEDDAPNQLATVIPVRQPDEFLCQSCFLLKPPGQLADRDHQLCRDCA